MRVSELINALSRMPQHAHLEFCCHDGFRDYVGSVDRLGDVVRLAGCRYADVGRPISREEYTQRTEDAWKHYVESKHGNQASD